MNYVPSISVDAVIDALVPFVKLFTQNNEVYRGQINRTPQAKSPCAYVTELLQADIDIPYQTYDAPGGVASLHGPKRIDVQIDVYGNTAGEILNGIKTAFRTEWGVSQFPANISPLYTDDGRQTPLITGEEQYENRWTLTVSLQYNPIITVPHQFAGELTVDVTQPVDVFEVLN